MGLVRSNSTPCRAICSSGRYESRPAVVWNAIVHESCTRSGDEALIWYKKMFLMTSDKAIEKLLLVT